MLASDYTVVSYGLAGILADISLGAGCDSSAVVARIATRLLDRILTLAVEISLRGGRSLADRAAADSSWVLCADRLGHTQPSGSMVAVDDRAHAGVHLRRLGGGIGNLQPAIRG